MKTHNTQPTTIPTLEEMIGSGSFGLVFNHKEEAVKVARCAHPHRQDWSCDPCKLYETEVEAVIRLRAIMHQRSAAELKLLKETA
tara:strand:+ start:59 stop:313 length:255 start_codon:yes stop_codon:yes gene_type:complete